MGSMLSSAFIPPGSLLGCEELPPKIEGMENIIECLPPQLSADWIWGMVQCMTLLVLYGYILFTASNMLSNGSELLLLVPSIAGVVGSVVLPILGAVPDGAIMLFSGLGPGAQESLQVGVGALAGSTIMLLTIPWGLCVLSGSTGVVNGEARYGVRKPRRGTMTRDFVLEERMRGEVQGVTPSPTIAYNAKIMLGTALIYLLIQGPAFPYATRVADAKLNEEISAVESSWALAGLVVSVLAFCLYLYLMIQQSESDVASAKVDATIKNEVSSASGTTLAGVIGPLLVQSAQKEGQGVSSTLVLDAAERKRLQALMGPFFQKYDTDADNKISVDELAMLLTDIGEPVTKAQAAEWMKTMDPDGSGSLHSSELLDALLNYIRMKTIQEAQTGGRDAAPEAEISVDDGDEEDEEVEVPEDLVHLTWQEQQAQITKRASVLMLVGTALVLVFSDPMVEVMSNMGERLSIPPFYISFVLAPLASNASELIASISLAKKKTQKTISVALATLEGAACMNNTFCLAIWMALIYFKGLAWKFSAETLAILIVQLLVGMVAMQRTQTSKSAYFVLSLFPLSIVFIAALESVGYDR